MTLHYEYEIPVSHYKRVTINKDFIEEVNKCLEYYIGENVITIGEEYIKDLFLGQLTDEDEVYLQGTRWHGVQSLSNFVKSAVSDAIIDWYDYEEEEWGDVTHESWDLTE